VREFAMMPTLTDEDEHAEEMAALHQEQECEWTSEDENETDQGEEEMEEPLNDSFQNLSLN